MNVSETIRLLTEAGALLDQAARAARDGEYVSYGPGAIVPENETALAIGHMALWAQTVCDDLKRGS